jgi:hypothetical protein
MAIIVNGERIPVTIDEMEVYFNPSSAAALNDQGLLLILENTNADGKKNWLTLARKYKRPAQIAQTDAIKKLLTYGAIGVGAYLLYKTFYKK